MNKLIALIGSLFIGSLALAQVSVNTLADDAADVRDTSVRQDQSNYASQSDRSFVIVRSYDFDVEGGSATAFDLDEGMQDIPDNSIITEVIIDVTEATDVTGTNSLSVGGVTLYSAATLDDGVGVIVVTGEDAAIGKTSSADKISLDLATAGTQGSFVVIVKGIQGQ